MIFYEHLLSGSSKIKKMSLN